MLSIIRMVLGMIFLGVISVSAQDVEMATAKMVGAKEAAPVFFDPGVKVLSPKEKSEIQAFFTTIREADKIKEVKVLAWGDREYPEKKEKASAKQIELAKARAESIRKYLTEDLKIKTVETHNMAERPSKMSEFLKTEDYEVKSSAEATGAAPTKSKTGIFEEMGRSTTALVFVVMK